MEKVDKSPPMIQEHGGSEQTQIFFVDGCKVTVRYSEHENPSAIRNIKDTLLAGISLRKS